MLGNGKNPEKDYFLHILRNVFLKKGEIGISMRIKLFLTLITLVITMFLGVLVVLMITGTFSTGVREAQGEIKNQLTHISQDIEAQYGQLSIQAVELSRGLSSSIQKKLTQRGLTTEDLQEHPEVLEEILLGEYDRCIFALQRSKSSGVFVILDATVNPSLDNSENSRAGLYIKNNEPNILNSSAPNILILRGFSSIGRQNSITLHSQWRMEFDVSNAPYFKLPMEKARNSKLPLTRLYYWNPSISLPGTSEEVMLCSIPLIGSDGNVFGVCGFEISSMLFKLSHMPDNSIYRRIFCILAPCKGDTMNTDEAFFAGGYSVSKITEDNQKLAIKRGKTLCSYNQDNGRQFVGLHNVINMYPKDSAFNKEVWTAALVMPREDIVSSIIKLNMQMTLLFILLLLFGIVISYYLSRRYIRPITKSIDIIKSNNYSEVLKTNIYEIDDLMEFLSSHRDENKAKEEPQEKPEESNKIKRLPNSLFDEFEKNTKTLSPAERAVFNLYVEGYTAKEITGILGLSINTIKTHNKRIYMKLNVTSREELLLYVNMLKEEGREVK